MSTKPRHTCPDCGSEFSGAMEFCPVCMLRQALAGGVESGESSASTDMVKPTPEQAVQRFENYELVTGEDRKPVELGRVLRAKMVSRSQFAAEATKVPGWPFVIKDS
jgi:hypothetical protein